MRRASGIRTTWPRCASAATIARRRRKTAASEGEVMAKQIIVLEKATTLDRGFRLVLWARPPVARQPYWKLIAPARSTWSGASQAENDEITNGQVVESVEVMAFDQDKTMPELQAAAEARWVAWNDYVQTFNPWRRYGSFWDGATWTLGGVV